MTPYPAGRTAEVTDADRATMWQGMVYSLLRYLRLSAVTSMITDAIMMHCAYLMGDGWLAPS